MTASSDDTKRPTPDGGADGVVSYARLRDLFVCASQIMGVERLAWLDAHVPDTAERVALQRLLNADDVESGILETPADRYAAQLATEESLHPQGMLGRRIGVFRLTQFVGQGGMSAVFLAWREEADFEQRVAVKLLRRGLYSDVEQRLFRRERQLLASLDHPNIARLIDGGVTSAGIPYLVMEYVDGISITEYAAHHGLDVAERLRLFVVVCRAVDAAHRGLIVHRDIKPSNILVAGDGTVKLLDFGIAKLLEEDTDNPTVAVFTPEYAAPEQLANTSVTTATDVYALGVLLHETLVGVRPQGKPARRPSSLVGADAVNRTNLPNPGGLADLLRGDVDNIVLKALEPEAQRRYASAGALADDIERFLVHQPVHAHPPSRRYRLRKFVQRHRVGVTASTAFGLAILGALGLALWQEHVARREAIRATHEATRANSVRDFLVSVFDTASEHLPRDVRPTPDALVAQAQKRLNDKAELDPSTRADMLATLGEVDLSLSNFARAQTSFEAALALEEQQSDPSAALRMRVLRADAMQRAGRNAEAVAALKPVLGPLRERPSTVSLRALAVLAAAEIVLGQPDAAIAHRREAAQDAKAIYGDDQADAIGVAFEVGNTLATVQRFPEAIAVLEPLLAQWRAAHAVEDDRYVAALSSLATATDAVGDVATMESRLRELLALKRRIYTSPHDSIAETLRDLALVVSRAEKYTEAETLAADALSMDKQIFGEDHREVAASYVAMGDIMLAQRRFGEADANYERVTQMCQRADIHEEVCPRARNNLGMSLYRQGRLDDARREMTQALAERRTLFGNDHPTVAYSSATLANVAVAQHDVDSAVRLSAEALAILERDGQGASREAVLIRNGYANALWLNGRGEEALHEIDRTLSDWQRLAPEAKARRVFMLALKARILVGMHRDTEARAVADEAIGTGANPTELSVKIKEELRQLSGRRDLYPDTAASKTSP
jgi:serine/threonine-protein kinase